MQRSIMRVWGFFRPDAARIGLVLVLMVLSQGAGLLKPWPLALIVDCLLGTRPLPGWLASHTVGWDRTGLLGLLVAAVFLFHLAQAALSAAQTYGLIEVGLRGLARVRGAVFHWLQRLSLRYHQEARQGDVIYRASWDTYAFQTLFQHGLFAFLSASFSLLLMGVVMWRLNRPLTLAALATVPVLLLAMRFFGRQMSARSRLAHQADSQVTSLVQQGMAALPLTQSYVREAHEERRFAAQAAEAFRQRLSQHGCEVLYLAVIAVIVAAGMALIAGLGAQQVWAGRLSLGELLIFLAYLGQFYEPLNQLSRVGSTFSDACAGTQRVLEILDAPEEVKESPQARAVVRTKGKTASADVLELQGAVVFDRVSFGYRPERLVLQDLSFRIEPGESLAIVGPSGAGKTTLVHLLPRFFDPLSGAVRLDGVDLRDLKLGDLRAQIALVMQEPILLPATIAENLAYGRPDATPAEIEAAARAAHADEFIRALPQRYETLVGEGAARLSVGEKQRISLARAFLKDAPILVLDEPTSALDAESEALVVSSLGALMRGRTTLVVAHRFSTIRRVDRVLVLAEGRLAQLGRPEELLRGEGYFARVAAGRWGKDQEPRAAG